MSIKTIEEGSEKDVIEGQCVDMTAGSTWLKIENFKFFCVEKADIWKQRYKAF